METKKKKQEMLLNKINETYFLIQRGWRAKITLDKITEINMEI